MAADPWEGPGAPWGAGLPGLPGLGAPPGRCGGVLVPWRALSVSGLRPHPLARGRWQAARGCCGRGVRGAARGAEAERDCGVGEMRVLGN